MEGNNNMKDSQKKLIKQKNISFLIDKNNYIMDFAIIGSVPNGINYNVNTNFDLVHFESFGRWYKYENNNLVFDKIKYNEEKKDL